MSNRRECVGHACWHIIRLTLTIRHHQHLKSAVRYQTESSEYKYHARLIEMCVEHRRHWEQFLNDDAMVWP